MAGPTRLKEWQSSRDALGCLTFIGVLALGLAFLAIYGLTQ